MKRNFLGAAVGTTCAVLMLAAAGSLQTLNTPLYTYRMEQMSSEMNFLITAVNDFSYTTEKGFTLIDESSPCCIEELLNPLTIGSTCVTCHDPTCVTCPDTCIPTCDDPTCPETCEPTCEQSTCIPTCGVSVCVCPTGVFC